MNPLTELTLTACAAGVSYGLYTLCAGALSYLQELTEFTQARRYQSEEDLRSQEEHDERFKPFILVTEQAKSLSLTTVYFLITRQDVRSYSLENYPQSDLEKEPLCTVHLVGHEERVDVTGTENIRDFLTNIGAEEND